MVLEILKFLLPNDFNDEGNKFISLQRSKFTWFGFEFDLKFQEKGVVFSLNGQEESSLALEITTQVNRASKWKCFLVIDDGKNIKKPVSVKSLQKHLLSSKSVGKKFEIVIKNKNEKVGCKKYVKVNSFKEGEITLFVN